MTIHQFFIKRSQIDTDQRVQLDGPDVHHIRNVLRLKKGAKIRLADENQNLYLASVEKVTAKAVLATLLEPIGIESPLARLSVVQGIPRLPRADFITQKLTELGACNIVFAPAKHSSYRDAFDRISARLSRLRKIAVAAAKQSGRRDIPKVLLFGSMEEAAKTQEPDSLLLVANEKSREGNLSELVSRAGRGGLITVFIGPEGGLSADEIRLLEGMGASSFSLGRNILRTETAALVAAAIILYELGEI
jgi:16S rRNA (uracil1498-N3)-methyltransferase